MGIVIPSDEIQQRWSGALQRRLRQAPLERLLRCQQLPVAPAGSTQLTDNLCRATVHLVEAGLGKQHDDFVYTKVRESALGPVACAVAHGLACGIDESESWRVAALVGIGEMLAQRFGCTGAARVAAAAAHEYYHGHIVEAGCGALANIRAAASRVLQTRQIADVTRIVLRHVCSDESHAA